MLGTDPAGKGGVASVIREYESAGLFVGQRVRLLVTHNGERVTGRILPALRSALMLWGALCLTRVELIHAHTSYGLSFWRKFLITVPALLLRVPVVIHLHSGTFPDFYAAGGLLRRTCLRVLLQRAWRVITVSDNLQRWVLTIEPRARTEVIHNSLSFDAGRNDRQPPGQRPTVLFLSRLDAGKGAYDLLQAFAAVLRSLPQARLVCGGDGDVQQFLGTARDLGIEYAVTYVGWAGHKQKEQLFAECWAVVLPSYNEGMPVIVIEAMAHSRPVVASHVGGIPEAIQDGISGLLVRPGDVATLAECLRRLLSDLDNAIDMGKAARCAFESGYSHEACLTKLLALYEAAGITDLPKLHCSRPADQRGPPLGSPYLTGRSWTP